ncbi:MAG: sigma-70 family RNA polymerase sigma factor [Acidimicrobiia bacterium]
MMDETQLIAAAQSGDRLAFDELVRLTYLDVFTLAVRLTGNDEDARDVVQDAYLRAWKAIGGFRGDAQLSTWLYRITANCASTYLSRRRRHRTEPLLPGLDPTELRHEVQPEAMTESMLELQRIAAALDELPPKLRSVVVLRDVYGLAHEAIAEELGISVSAAKVRLHRARKQLRDEMFEERRSERAL